MSCLELSSGASVGVSNGVSMGGGVFPNVLKGIRQDKTFTKRWKSYWWWVGGGCIWIIASALWSRVFSLRLVNELKCLRQRQGP